VLPATAIKSAVHPELIREMAMIASPSLIIADVRNMYHACSVHDDISYYLGVICELKGKVRYFRYTTTPMGWTYSVFFAVCLMWSIILAVEPNEVPWYEVPEGGWAQPPRLFE